ncbi:hypothetical protein Tco_0040029 [Tanacetum coccineum]
MKNTVLNVHPTTSTSTTTTSDLQQQLYLKMKLDLQSQVADPELWNALKAKYEKSSASTNSCRYDAFCKRDHEDHPGDDAPPKEEKSAKRQKTSRSSKSVIRSLSKQPVKESNISASKQPQQHDLDAWVNIPVIDEDEVIPKDETPKLLMSTDKAKSIRKRLKPGKHEHKNGRAHKKPGGSYQGQKVNS